MTSEKFEKLKTLGRPTNKWQDYLPYGFDVDDIEPLLAIVGQNTSLPLIEYGDEIWAPIHAWRVLGQLGDEQIIAPLIALLNQFSLSDDDWYIQELPLVFAMIGQAAINPLKHFLCIRTNEEYARVVASDALAEIYKKDKTLQAAIIDAYNHYLQSPDQHAYDLNGLIVNNIMNMKTQQLIDPISKMFVNNIVNDSICGELSDVNKALGLKHKELKASSKTIKASRFSFEENYHIINKYLKKYATEYSLQEISHLDGYLAAIICSDELIIPSVWSIELWGGKGHQPRWQNHEELEEFNNCVFEYYKQLCTEFAQDKYQPLIIEDEKGNTYPTVWCIGFIDASNFWRTTSEDFSIPATLGFGMIAILADENPEEKIQELNIDVQTMEDKLAENVATIYHEMHDEIDDDYDYSDNPFADFESLKNYNRNQEEQPYVREGKKVGRNEPCPCGSGKKHKKCCLNKQ